MAVLSAAPHKAKAGSSWLGSPPIRLRRHADEADASLTYQPSARLRLMRSAVETCRLIPVMVTFAIGVAVLAVLQALALRFGYGWAALACGVLLLAAGRWYGSAVAAKWLVVGRIRAVEYPLWSSFVWRNEVSDTFVETVAGTVVRRAASGTPVMNLWLRALGAKIGRGVWCETYWLPEADLVTLERGSTVNRGCVVQTHLFHDRIMRMDTVVLEDGATLGPHCVALPAARIGGSATVRPASLVMRGDEVPPSTRWQGNPIAPWTDSAKKPRTERTRREARAPRRETTPEEGRQKGGATVIDPYLPRNGNFWLPGVPVRTRPEYKVAINRLAGTATITAVTLASLQNFTLDMSDALVVNKVIGERAAAAHFRSSGGKLHIALAAPLPAGRRCRSPSATADRRGRSGTVWGGRFRGAVQRVLVAGQPNGAASWFPATTIPAPRPAIASRSAPTAPIARWPTASWCRAGYGPDTVWTYEQPEPTSTYLITLQIGMYETHTLAKAPVPMRAVLPDRLRSDFDHDFGRQPQMMKLFVKLFGPYPLANGTPSWSPTTISRFPEAQGISIFGANHCDRTGGPSG